MSAAVESAFSVVIIARNEEAHIGRCIESVLAATESLGRCDVVLVDSCSNDRTVEIARAYPIRVIELARRQRCCPALGRHVGVRLTRGQYVVCVDGDTEIDRGWVTAALAVLSARAALGGVAGQEEQVYYQNGLVAGGKADYFDAGPVERVVDQFGGNAIYRRTALEGVGSFNPSVRSFEEAELGARLRRAGWGLVRIPVLMGRHHTQKPDSVDEYWRRVRSHLFTGQGQVLRIALQQGLFWEHARRLNRVLLVMLWVAIGGATAVVSAALSRAEPVVAWLAVSAVLMVAFMLRSGSVTKPFKLIFDWAACSLPLAWGFLLTPADPARFRLEDAVVAGDCGGDSASHDRLQPLENRQRAAWDLSRVSSVGGRRE